MLVEEDDDGDVNDVGESNSCGCISAEGGDADATVPNCPVTAATYDGTASLRNPTCCCDGVPRGTADGDIEGTAAVSSRKWPGDVEAVSEGCTAEGEVVGGAIVAPEGDS